MLLKKGKTNTSCTHPRPLASLNTSHVWHSAYFSSHSLSQHSCCPCLVHHKFKVMTWFRCGSGCSGLLRSSLAFLILGFGFAWLLLFLLRFSLFPPLLSSLHHCLLLVCLLVLVRLRILVLQLFLRLLLLLPLPPCFVSSLLLLALQVFLFFFSARSSFWCSSPSFSFFLLLALPCYYSAWS